MWTDYINVLSGNVMLTGHDMSPFIRRYSRYIDEKATAYRQTGYDFCKVKRGLVLWFHSN